MCALALIVCGAHLWYLSEFTCTTVHHRSERCTHGDPFSFCATYSCKYMYIYVCICTHKCMHRIFGICEMNALNKIGHNSLLSRWHHRPDANNILSGYRRVQQHIITLIIYYCPYWDGGEQVHCIKESRARAT